MSNFNQQRSDQGLGSEFIPGYVIEDSIGQGSFATVYRGHHQTTKKCVAIKTILKNRLKDKVKENLETEISVLLSLQHPNITKLYNYKETETKVCLIMELCSFGDLSDYIKRNRHQPGIGGPAGGLSEVIFRHFLQQLASAFKFLRSKNIIHRDLKPQNILLSEPTEVAEGASRLSGLSNYANSLPQLKVADFGFAKVLPKHKLTETTCGSPLYMAPEIFAKKSYDASTDLWSIGTVLHEMVTGRPPIIATSQEELIRRIRDGKDRIWFPGEPVDTSYYPNIPDDITETSFPIDQNLVSEDIKDLIRRLLKQDPADRISFDDFFSHPAIRSFEVPPRPLPPKPKAKLQQVVFENAHRTESTRNGENNLPKTQLGIKKAPSLSRLNGLSRQQQELPSGNRRASAHIRAHTVSLEKKSGEIEDYAFEKEYIMIDSEFDNMRISNRKEEPRARTSPLAIQPTYKNPYKVKPRDVHPGFDVLPTPKSLPKSLLGEPPVQDSELTQAEKGSPPRFRPRSDSHADALFSGESGWKVGSNAASVLANAISKASLKLFGARGLSPPASQYRADSCDPTAFPLEGPSASSKEEVVLQEMEQVACQAYALVKFADKKLNRLRTRTDFFNVPIGEPDKKASESVSNTSQEAFLLYAKALGLLYIGFDKVSTYWSKVLLSQNEVIVSGRLSRAARWLQDKTNECLEKAELVQSKMTERSLMITSYDTDHLIYDYALNSCQDGVFKEIKGDRILESETDYLMGLWMLQAIMFRAPQDPSLSGEDATNIRLMMTMVEDRLINYRKSMDEHDLRQYTFSHSHLPSYNDAGRPSRT